LTIETDRKTSARLCAVKRVGRWLQSASCVAHVQPANAPGHGGECRDLFRKELRLIAQEDMSQCWHSPGMAIAQTRR